MRVGLCRCRASQHVPGRGSFSRGEPPEPQPDRQLEPVQEPEPDQQPKPIQEHLAINEPHHFAVEVSEPDPDPYEVANAIEDSNPVEDSDPVEIADAVEIANPV